MGTWSFWEKEVQLNTVRNHDGEVHKTSIIRRLFNIGLTTSFLTLWLYTQGHLEKVGYARWKVIANPMTTKQYGQAAEVWK